MLNDRQASELLSKSLAKRLSTSESTAVAEHLTSSADSRSFERISRLIQESLSGIAVMAQDGDESVAPSLSADAKRRMKDSIRRASQRIPPGFATENRNVVSPDTALAMILMEQGMVTEDRLAELIQSWQPTRLGELGGYLSERGILTETQRLDLEQRAADWLKAVGDNESHEAEVASKLYESVTLSQIDSASKSASSPVKSRKEKGDTRQVVTRFKLLKKLGEGGLGSVWLARDEKLKRTVAIKEMNAAVPSRAWQRFHREAEITGFLEHPNVVPLYEFGSDPKTGQPFYAMRFVGKRTLADAILEYHERRKANLDVSIDLRRLLNAFLGVCQAIAYAHSRGVIHRDLKPENVALDNFGQVIVLDWGLAKLTDDGELASNLDLGPSFDEGYLARTQAGEVVGTPLYMAPEQAAGDLTQVDEKSDIYGLGAILFSILTGKAPHEQKRLSNDKSPPLEEILQAIATTDAPAPREFNPAVPADLESICLRAISRNRFARPSSASELAEEVERWMAGQTEKQQQYDHMRMEGREIRAMLQSAIADLNTNVRFMANLPPIQEIIDLKAGVSSENESIWRDRLAVIYAGLLRANLDYSAIGFGMIDDGTFQEIVRVERHSTDAANIRTVPLSRLAAGEIDNFQRCVMQQQPDEVSMSLENPTGNEPVPKGRRRLRAGVPLYDRRTEQPFGYVWIECELEQIIVHELRTRAKTAQQVLFIDPNGDVWLHDTRSAGVIGETTDKPAEDVCSSIPSIIEYLQSHSECVCERDRNYYATRVDLGSRNQALYIVLSLISHQQGEKF